MTDQDNWLEMSYYKYKNPTNLIERLNMEEKDLFYDIDEDKNEEEVGEVIEQTNS